MLLRFAELAPCQMVSGIVSHEHNRAITWPGSHPPTGGCVIDPHPDTAIGTIFPESMSTTLRNIVFIHYISEY